MIVPLIVAAATAVAVLIVDLVLARWAAPYLVALAGAAATALAALTSATGPAGISLLCAGRGVGGGANTDCSYVFDDTAQVVATAVALLTAAAVLLYGPPLRTGDAPAGESMFLLASAMTGGVALAGAGDLLTLIVALETLTLPLYALVALHRRRAGQAAEASVTFFVTSVVATATALLGASLIYLDTGWVHLRGQVTAPLLDGGRTPAVSAVGLALLLAGLGFKVAAVPLHAWAPKTYDGAPLPVAAFLSTASKLGGVLAILIVVNAALSGRSGQDIGVDVESLVGGVLGVLAVASMIIGTLGALQQQRTVRLLAWSSVAQAGFILAPLAGLIGISGLDTHHELLGASLAYTLFFLVLEIAAFSAVTTLRAGRADGGTLADLAGLGRTAPMRSLGLVLALIGLAGLPPTLAGLFAKVTVVRALLDADAVAVALLVALISVVGLAVYWRLGAALYRAADGPTVVGGGPRQTGTADAGPLVALTAAVALAAALSIFPQMLYDLITVLH